MGQAQHKKKQSQQLNKATYGNLNYHAGFANFTDMTWFVAWLWNPAQNWLIKNVNLLFFSIVYYKLPTCNFYDQLFTINKIK